MNTQISPQRIEMIKKRVSVLIERIKAEVMPDHRRRCEDKEKAHPNRVRFDDEVMRALESNSLVAELRRLQKVCPHDWTGFQEDKTWVMPAKTNRCIICHSNETVFESMAKA
jgi:hypothetical protein